MIVEDYCKTVRRKMYSCKLRELCRVNCNCAYPEFIPELEERWQEKDMAELAEMFSEANEQFE